VPGSDNGGAYRAWDYLAEVLEGPRRPRSAYTFEQIRRSLICLSAYLTDCDRFGGTQAVALTEATAREFVADFTRRVTNRQPVRGVFNADGSPTVATPTTYVFTMNAVRRVMRHAMDSGAAARALLTKVRATYIYGAFEKSSQALAGLEKALLALGLLDQARELDLRSPHQEFFDPIWRQGWRAGDLVHIGSGGEPAGHACPAAGFDSDDVDLES